MGWRVIVHLITFLVIRLELILRQSILSEEKKISKTIFRLDIANYASCDKLCN